MTGLIDSLFDSVDGERPAFGRPVANASIVDSPIRCAPAAEPIPWLGFWFAGFAFAVLWFGFLGYRTLISPDEGRYASLALEMLRSGDFVTPRLNGLPYFEKPALPYWAGALAFRLFGVNEFAARLWPGLTSFLAVGLVGATGARLWGTRTGVFAALAMGSMLWVFGNGHFLTLDAGLMFFLTLALCALLIAQQEVAANSRRRAWMLVAWAAMAGATLTKGLVGLAIPAASLAAYSLMTRDWILWRRLHWRSGVAVYAALTLPWFIAVSQRNPGFAEFFFIHEHLDRFLTTQHHRSGPVWYFVPLLLLGTMPWTSMVFPALRGGLGASGHANFQPRRMLLAWIGFVFAFFSLSGSKLPPYILPLFPALALLLASYIERVDTAALKRHLLLPIAVAAAGLATLPFTARFLASDLPGDAVAPALHAGALASASLLLLAALAWLQLDRGRKLAAMALLAAGGLLSAALAMGGFEDYSAQVKSSRPVAAALRPYMEDQTPVFAVADYDQTLPFYLRRPVTLVAYTGEFELGQQLDARHWIPTLDAFAERWRALPQAAAVMPDRVFLELDRAGLPMREVFANRGSVAVVKPRGDRPQPD